MMILSPINLENMSRLGMEHHMFLQTLAARRIVSEREAEELITKCLELAGISRHHVLKILRCCDTLADII